MADIRLRDYVARIKDMIRGDQHNEAIAHCRHILRHYSKHIETYCLLGEACLEKEMVRESIEFFQRTLSADPENFIARVGMGIIYEGQGLLEEAVWQMERAFELVPGNAEVRQELQRLYAQRDGKEKARLKLTRGALGRLYCRNGLYERAITEFRAVLRQEPDLPDVRVALIEALWREGRRLEAVEACLELLDALPNCLKANLILAEIWMRGGHEDAGGEKLELARALDPENLVAQEMMGRDSPLPPEDIFIPEFDFARSVSLPIAPQESVAAVSWGTREEETGETVGESLMLGSEEEWETGEGLPDWLVDIGVTEVAESEIAEGVVVPGGEESPSEELPDWLTELAGARTASIARKDVSPLAGEVVASASEEQPLDEDGMPDWLREIQTSAAEKAAASTGADAEVVLAAEVPDQLEDQQDPDMDEGTPVAEVPDWLHKISEPEGEEATLPAEEVPVAEMPAWLRELQSPGVGESPPSEADFPAAQKVPEAEVVLPAVEASLVEEVPDWLRDLELEETEDVEPQVAVPTIAEAPPDEDVPAWLRELHTPGVEEVVSLPAVEDVLSTAEVLGEDTGSEGDVPDWLRDLGAPGEDRFTLPGEEDLTTTPVEEEALSPEKVVPQSLQALVEAGILDEADLDTAMAEMSAEELEAQQAQDVPGWLQDLMGEEPLAEEVAPAEPAVEMLVETPSEVTAQPTVETPPATEKAFDWLQELEEEVAPSISDAGLATAGGAMVAEVPDWLQGLEEPQDEESLPSEADAPPEHVLPTAEAMPAKPVPASLQALVDAGLLDEADLDTAIAEMSDEDLEAQRAQEVPVWLQELMDEEPPLAEDLPASEAEESWMVEIPAEEATAEVPAWLRELEEPEVEEAVPLEVEGPAAEEPSAIEIPAEEATAEVPPWLQELAEPEVEEAVPLEVEELAAEEPLEVEIPAEELTADVPAWLRELEFEDLTALEMEEPATEEPSPVEIPAEEPIAKVPAWLREFEEPEFEEATSLEVEELAAEELPADEIPVEEPTVEIPAWLREFEEPDMLPSEVESAAEQELRGAQVPEKESLPAWLREFEERDAGEAIPAEVESAAKEEPPVIEVPEEEALPAWLREFEEPETEGAEALAEEAPPPVEISEEEVLPAWLRGFEEYEKEAVSPAVEVPPLEAEAAPIAKNVPASLQALVEAGILDEADLEAAMAEMSAEDLVRQQSQAVPDWLHDLMGEEALPPGVEEAEDVTPVVEEFEPAPAPAMLEESPLVEETVPVVDEAIPILVEEESLELVVDVPAEVPTSEEPLPVAEEQVPVSVVEREAEPPSVEKETLPDKEAELPPTEMEMIAPFERVEVEEEAAPPSPVEELSALLKSHPRDYRARLELAQAYQAEQNWNAALDQYEKLVSARKFLPVVVDELKVMADKDIDRPRLFQVLGDAYMNQDKLETALDMYRQAREALIKR